MRELIERLELIEKAPRKPKGWKEVRLKNGTVIPVGKKHEAVMSRDIQSLTGYEVDIRTKKDGKSVAKCEFSVELGELIKCKPSKLDKPHPGYPAIEDVIANYVKRHER